MDRALEAAVAALIEHRTGEVAVIVAARPVGGGCINRAETVELADGRSFFVKSNPAPLPGMFEREAEGLAALAAAASIRVPRPLGAGGAEAGAVSFLVTEAITTGTQRPDFSAIFGRRSPAST